MYGFILPNPQGLQIDIYGKVFLLRVGIGIAGGVAGYSRYLLQRAKKRQTLQAQHQEHMERMRTQLHMSGAPLTQDQKLVIQFVAYLEKFTTKQQSYSRESLLLGQ